MTTFGFHRLFAGMPRSVLAVLAGLCCLGTSLVAQEKAERVYVFGNSLVHHLSDEAQTNVPYWMAQMSKAAGHKFALSGQWGFMRSFAGSLPASANWSIKGVSSAIRSGRGGSFADLSSVWLTPANFIQYKPPSEPYDGENPNQASPLSAATTVAKWVAQTAPNARIYVYEGWPDMAETAPDFPPTQNQLAAYHDMAQSSYAQWFDQFTAQLDQEIGAPQVTLMPVSRVLAFAMTHTALADLPAQTFYSDSAPHGTPTLYLMAAMVAYNMLYEAPLPPEFRPPASIAPALREHFTQVRDTIWERVRKSLPKEQATLSQPASPVVAAAPTNTPTTDAQTAAAKEAAPAGQPREPQPRQSAQPPARSGPISRSPEVANPSLAMGLNGISDWSVQHPFMNVMKTARPWIGHKNGEWAGYTVADLDALGLLDENGWPRKIPDDTRMLEAFLFTDQPAEAEHLKGRYVLTYEGEGIIEISGRAQNVRRSKEDIRFSYEPGDGLVSIRITKTDPKGTGNHIRNIAIVKQEYRPLFAAGLRFNPDFVKRIERFRSLRFMDWMFTNGSSQRSWDKRPLPSDFSYAWRGVPLEIMMELSNLVGADPWLNIPHMADDAYIRAFAEKTKALLRPDLKAFVEYSNEVWNFAFPQAIYAQTRAAERWGDDAGEDAWMQFYGMRAAQMAQIWRDVFGQSAQDRLALVIATHTGWLGLEEAILNAPLWVSENPSGHSKPYVYFDAYAVTGYFGFEMGSEERAPEVLSWLSASKTKAGQAAEAKGLTGAQKDSYIETHLYDAAQAQMTAALLEGSVKELTDVIFPAQARLAKAHGLDLVMYEGGTHISVTGAFSSNQDLISFFKQYNYSPHMGRLYKTLLDAWMSSGGTLFNAFVDLAKPSQYGSWGTLRHLNDDNERWRVLSAFNADTPAWWENRSGSVFADGVIELGSTGDDKITGTAFSDHMAGLDGDDTFDLRGGRDAVNGGPGFDIALMQGLPSDYSFEVLEDTVVLKAETSSARLRDVEMLWFSQDDTLAIMVQDLR